ncbi:MAG: histidine phosphatase family protein [bacterium JZ-2024 1]
MHLSDWTPINPMGIWIARHGQTIWNAEGRIQGRSNPPLTQKGMEETFNLVEYLSHQDIHRIFTSPLERCKILAFLLAERKKIPLTIAPELQELSFGSWEGLKDEEIREKFPEQWDLWKKDPYSFHPGGGESFAQMSQRVLPFFHSFRQDDPPVVLVTHLGVIQVILSDFLGISITDFSAIFLHTGILFYLQKDTNSLTWYTPASLQKRIALQQFLPLHLHP